MLDTELAWQAEALKRRLLEVPDFHSHTIHHIGHFDTSTLLSTGLLNVQFQPVRSLSRNGSEG